MAALPRVSERTRERISKEFDDLGPEFCVVHVSAALERENPEILDMATKCARDTVAPTKTMVGFSMFYRLLALESRPEGGLLVDGNEQRIGALPRVTPETRNLIAHRIDEQGPDEFTRSALALLERDNPELLYMAHNFSAGRRDYLRIMQGFGLLYACLAAQAAADRGRVH